MGSGKFGKSRSLLVYTASGCVLNNCVVDDEFVIAILLTKLYENPSSSLIFVRKKSLIKVSTSSDDGRFSGFASQHFLINSLKYSGVSSLIFGRAPRQISNAR